MAARKDTLHDGALMAPQLLVTMRFQTMFCMYAMSVAGAGVGEGVVGIDQLPLRNR